MFQLILSSLYFMLPAYAANSLPVIAAKLRILEFFNKPIDFNKKFLGRQIFGKHKTIRGIIVGILGALIISYLQFLLSTFEPVIKISPFYYSLENSLLVGFLLGSGALLGDLVKSFLKRQQGIQSGKTWPLMDQLDYVFGAILLTAIVFIPSIEQLIVIFIASPLLALLANVIAFKLGIKKVWW